jgi:two-component system CheB/CheR fusion protein
MMSDESRYLDRRPAEETPVAGIGYSAGGLEAIQRLLSHLSTDTGLAFVVIQHLKSDQKSNLPDILARSTKMPVRTIENGICVEPNTVFITPPGFDVALTGDFLNLNVRGKSDIHDLGIDFFLSSLSQSRKSKAIGVILSGAGSDGTIGLKAIKSEGGVSIVQDPKTARFDGMPRSAIAAGIADLILSPESIAVELERLAKHPYTKSALNPDLNGPHSTPPEPAPQLAEKSMLGQILDILLFHTKIDFSQYKLSTIQRRIERQMLLRKIETIEKYANYLSKNADEVKALYEDIFIHVTDFFRDPDSFDALVEKAFPEIVKGRDENTPIRVWIPGCATGEEVYSLAISLHEYLEDKNLRIPVNLFAGDISEPALQKARKGVYADYQMGSVSQERLEKFFDKVNGGYKIKKHIRDLCIFSRHDVTSNPPIPNVDLISCRNVLIYFSSDLQKRVFPVFHYALNLNGFLWLGRAENPESTSKLFIPVDKTHKIFAKAKAPPAIPHHFSTTTYVASGIPAPFIGQTSSLANAGGFVRSADQLILYRYSPPSVVIDGKLDILQFRGRTVPYLEPPSGIANYNLLKMANPEITAPLRLCIQAAMKEDGQARKEGVTFDFEGKKKRINIEVSPLNPTAPPKERQYLVVFEDASALKAARVKAKAVEKDPKSRESHRTQIETLTQYTAQLQQELAAAREYQQSLTEEYEAAQEELTSANEELRSTNEELQSTNEELHSTNEELGTAKEELQAANEELLSTNDELQKRNIDLEAALKELEQSEQRFRLMVEAVKDYAIFMLDVEGRVTTWNEGAKRFKGYDASEIIGQHFSIFYPPETRDWKPKQGIDLAIRDGRFEDEDWRVRKDGSKFWADVVITAIRDSNQKLIGFAKVTRDLTERRKIEQERLDRERQEIEFRELKEREEQFRSLANSLPQLVWIANSDGYITWYNRRWYEYTGTEPKDMEGWGWQSVHDPKVLPEVVRRWKASLTTGETFEMEFPLKGSDGKFRWFLTRVEPMRDPQGKLVRWFGTNTDVDERRQQRIVSGILASASAVISNSLDYDETLHSFANALVTGFAEWCTIAILDSSGQPRIEATAHSDPNKLNQIWEVFENHSIAWNAPLELAKVIRKGQSQLFKEVSEETLKEVARDSDELNRLFNLGMRSALIVPLMARGRTLGAITLLTGDSQKSFTDAEVGLAEELGRRAGVAIEHALLYKNAQEAIRVRDEFLSIASHELKTPLTSLQLQAQIRERNAFKENMEAFTLAKLRRMFEMDKKQLSRLTRLIDDMLDVTRISARKLAFRFEKDDLHVILKEVLERLAPQFSAVGCTVDLEACDSAQGSFDRYRVEQVIVNLLTNALRYGEGKPVHVSLRQRDGKAVLAVRDEGIGIAEEDQARIFEPFERATESSAGKGLGLGLYIAKQIVEGHGGTIRVESKLNHGASFIVEFPLND